MKKGHCTRKSLPILYSKVFLQDETNLDLANVVQWQPTLRCGMTLVIFFIMRYTEKCPKHTRQCCQNLSTPMNFTQKGRNSSISYASGSYSYKPPKLQRTIPLDQMNVAG